MEELGFLSIDLGTILFTLANTLILFLGVKAFLFKPVKKIIAQRQEDTDKELRELEEAKSRAQAAEDEYTQKLATAKEESAEMLRTATRRAQQRSEEIVAEAKADAENIMRANTEELERERRKAEAELRGEVSNLAVMVAEKVVEREIHQEDHDRLIEEFIDSVGGL